MDAGPRFLTTRPRPCGEAAGVGGSGWRRRRSDLYFANLRSVRRPSFLGVRRLEYRRSFRRGKSAKTRSMSAGTSCLSSRTKAPNSRFSRTVIRGKMRRPSGEWAIPICTILLVERPLMRLPSKRISPRLGPSVRGDRHADWLQRGGEDDNAQDDH